MGERVMQFPFTWAPASGHRKNNQIKWNGAKKRNEMKEITMKPIQFDHIKNRDENNNENS